MRNATAFRGEATKTASPCDGTDLLPLSNVPVERLRRKNFHGGAIPCRVVGTLRGVEISPWHWGDCRNVGLLSNVRTLPWRWGAQLPQHRSAPWHWGNCRSVGLLRNVGLRGSSNLSAALGASRREWTSPQHRWVSGRSDLLTETSVLFYYITSTSRRQ